MPGVMEERKNVPFTLVKRKTDESLEKILCNLLKTEYSWKRRKIYLQTVPALRYAYPMEAVASQ